MKKGFSLIELLCVLAIVGILVSLAFPNYQQYVLRARRSDAKTSLLDSAAKLERFYINHLSYKGAHRELKFPINSQQGFYQIQLSVANERQYLLKAIPLRQQQLDKDCYTFTYNELGLEGVEGGAAIAEKCW